MAFRESKGGQAGITKARYVAYITIIACSAVLIYFFGFRGMRFFLVPSASMEPTLYAHDYLLTLTEGEYARGDIVVLEDPNEPKSYLVKRIVGVAGDTLRIEGGALFINDHYASEPYIREPMIFEFDPNPPLTVKPGEVFVMGDNRNDSEDSVTWERAVPLESVVGRVVLIYNPISRMGPVKAFPLTNVAGE
ncbi:MAG: signal peptidase I [Candidatus Hydrogenedentes bacterium]|nr:signal peptidase I [Candidatus Hydrogenedentota bacterium]